ncbi:MAG TPA: DUF6803 family protein [Symbiobacteriaceae bacterium]|nr:DUF6803 family protein [Symbiobacteriaceae bacterium]
MDMTHYMGLIADNQPWNLIIFMALPVVMAETLVATEFFVVFRHLTTGALRQFNKILGIVLGLYMTGIFIKMLTIIPGIEWNTWVDVIAVWGYTLGALPLIGIALMEMGLIFRKRSEQEKMKIHFLLITAFLVLGHVAMVFGMVNPEIIKGAATRGHM